MKNKEKLAIMVLIFLKFSFRMEYRWRKVDEIWRKVEDFETK